MGQVVEDGSSDGKENYRLNQPSNLATMQPDVLIHCAMTREVYQQIEDGKNFQRIKRIIAETCNIPNIKIIFISSLSFHSKSLSLYGQSKFRLEEYLSELSNVYIVRAGVICGENVGGFGKILNRIANIPLIQISISRIELYLTPLWMLQDAIFSIVKQFSGAEMRKFIIADSNPWLLTDFLEMKRSRFKLLRVELSLKRLLSLINFSESKLHFRLALFASIKSYANPVEIRNFVWSK
jgi:hypothetical protein